MYVFAPKNFPTDPGVYLMKNQQGRVIYVGKAVNLRARLASYFRGVPEHPKTRVMVAQVAGVDVLVTATEKEALLLEASLIKKHRPRYNIDLKDDKNYILFKLDKSHTFPKLSFTRRVVKDGSVYFGPFTSAGAARKTWKELSRMFPLRQCRDVSFENRARPCLYHHLGQCLGPCAGLIGPEEYARVARRVEAFLSGRSKDILKRVEREMLEASDALAFERAAGLRDLLAAMRQTVEGQAAVLPNYADLDVIETFAASGGIGLSILFVRQGRLLDRVNFFWPETSEQELEEALPSFLTQHYRPESFIPPRVLLPGRLIAVMGETATATASEILTERRGETVRISGPKSADEKRLLEIAAANAARAVAEAREAAGAESVPALLGRKLHVGRELSRIEVVDASHLGGTNMQVGQVVFEDGRFAKDAYRLYAMSELEGTGDDYAALAAWVARRVRAGEPWPDLVLIDGGKGQLAAVERAMTRLLEKSGGNMETGGTNPEKPEEIGSFLPPDAPDREEAQKTLEHPWELASIAKSGRSKNAAEDVIFRTGRKNPLPLRPGSKELLFLQKLRDEAHRFVIGRQRKARKKTALQSDVLAVPGIGPKTARILWESFGTIERMHAATLEELLKVKGVNRTQAVAVFKAFHTD